LILGIILIITIAIIIFINQKKLISKNKLLHIKDFEISEANSKILKQNLENSELENKNLENEILYKNRELQNFALFIVDKNDFIDEIKTSLRKIVKSSSQTQEIQDIIHQITNKLTLEKEREEFLANIDQINNNFFKNLDEKFPSLTETDKRLASLLKMGLHSKEIAAIMNITSKSVDTNRYRLRKKLNLDSDTNLNEYFKK
jgi:hypothetical protein